MINFFVLSQGKSTRQCSAVTTDKAVEILKLLFLAQQAYVVEDNRISFAQNMSIEEAEVLAGIKPMQSIVQLPVAPKKKAKKTKMKSKVVIKAKKTKKTKVKSKVVIKAKKTKVKSKPKGKKPAKR